jgi:Glycosyltransferase family 87
MPPDHTEADRSMVLASAPVAGAPAKGEPAVELPRFGRPSRLRLSLPRVRALSHPLAGRLALFTLLFCAGLIVVFASSGVNVLVPRTYLGVPNWESGPLHYLFRWLPKHYLLYEYGFSAVLVVMLGAYAVVLASVRTLSMRTIAAFVLLAHGVILLSPPLQLSDVWNYLGYAHLGALHHLNPYTHTMLAEIHDPAYRFASWHNLSSPYGPLFTALTYPLAFLPIPVAYWTIKVFTMAASLGLIAVVWSCARTLGRDPRYAVAFVAANPVYLMYAMAGFHNDFFLLLPSTAAIALVLAKRDRSAGVVLTLAVAVKFTAVILLPFLLLAARPARRRREMLIGIGLGAVPMVALSLSLFGFSLPNLSQQSTLLTGFSITNVVGWAIGLGGGTPGLLRVASVGVVVAVALLLRSRGDWVSRAGWATMALIASLSWLMPWYAIWVLPLAVIGTSVRLRRASLALTVFVLLTFIPWTGIFLSNHSINPLSSPVGQASSSLAQKLSH